MGGWGTAVAAALGILAGVVAAVLGRRQRKREKEDGLKADRKASAAERDLDIEHLDRERLRRHQG